MEGLLRLQTCNTWLTVAHFVLFGANQQSVRSEREAGRRKPVGRKPEAGARALEAGLVEAGSREKPGEAGSRKLVWWKPEAGRSREPEAGLVEAGSREKPGAGVEEAGSREKPGAGVEEAGSREPVWREPTSSIFAQFESIPTWNHLRAIKVGVGNWLRHPAVPYRAPVVGRPPVLAKLTSLDRARLVQDAPYLGIPIGA
jgi:hypothetical protein